MTTSVSALLKQHWKLLVGVTGAFAWWSVSLEPHLSLANRFTFTLFFVRLYWPELLIALLLVVWLAVLRIRGILEWQKTVTRCLGETRNGWSVLPRWHKVLGSALLLTVALFTLNSWWFHISRAATAELQFALSGHLMDWFRNDVLRVAAIAAHEGRYAESRTVLRNLTKELKGSPQSELAADLVQRMEYMDAERTNGLALVRRRFSGVGVTRQDIWLHRYLASIAPEASYGANLKIDPDGLKARVVVYQQSLLSAQAACKDSTASTLDARAIGEALSALGFARNPEWFEPRADVESRRARLCSVLTLMSVESATAAHKAAFAEGAHLDQSDWRSQLDPNYHITTGWIVARSVLRALDMPMAKLTGRTGFTNLLGPRPDRTSPASTKWTTENSSLYATTEPTEKSPKKDIDDPMSAFIPVRLGRSVSDESDSIVKAWFQLPNTSDQITLCFVGGAAKTYAGLSLHPSGARRLTASHECEAPPREALSVNQEQAIGTLITDLVVSLDRNALRLGPGLEPGLVKTRLCAAAVHSAGQAQQDPTRLLGICPREVLASANSLSFPTIKTTEVSEVPSSNEENLSLPHIARPKHRRSH